jgi:hypothetical protein
MIRFLNKPALGLVLLTLVLPLNLAFGFNNDPLQGMHQELLSEIDDLEPTLLPELEILWRGTLQRNSSIQLALEKMAEKTGQLKHKDRSAWTQNMLRGLVQIGGFGGAALAGNPAPLLGSAFITRATAPDTVAKELTKVTSADLVILTREIEETQSQLLLNFLSYRQSCESYKQQLQAIEQHHALAKSLPQDNPDVTDLLRTTSLQSSFELQQIEGKLQSNRQVLVLLSGENAVKEVDKHLEELLNVKLPTHAPIESPTQS